MDSNEVRLDEVKETMKSLSLATLEVYEDINNDVDTLSTCKCGANMPIGCPLT